MLLILEGCDRTGKTTLAHAVCRETRAGYTHHGPPEDHPLLEYEVQYKDFDPRRHKLVIDRLHLGERVWPTIFDRESQLDTASFIHIEMFLRSRGAVLVYAVQPAKRIQEALAAGVEPLDVERTEEALELYRAALDETCLPQYRHDFTQRPLDPKQLARKMQYHAEQVNLIHEVTPWWIGNPRPKVLLVGEQANDEIGIPFVPFTTTSGHFMLNELATDRAWQSIAIVNALLPDGGDEDLIGAWFAFDTPPVIALGRTACVKLSDAQVPHATVHHPQYVRRFLRKNGPGWYYSQIAEAIGEEVLRR